VERYLLFALVIVGLCGQAFAQTDQRDPRVYQGQTNKYQQTYPPPAKEGTQSGNPFSDCTAAHQDDPNAFNNCNLDGTYTIK
jgi:hypothetical protein